MDWLEIRVQTALIAAMLWIVIDLINEVWPP
jgi:hypothetical protein